MSASSKKKLRKEQEAAKLTEQQLAARKEAKTVNLYTIGFIAVMVVILVVAITVGVNQTITSSGIREKNTAAATVGSHELSNAELNYFYMDAVNQFYSNYGSYAAMFGLDVSKPLNEQVVDETTGKTWADDFMESAKTNAQSAYALADAAKAAGFSLTEEEKQVIESNTANLDLYATMYGYADGEAYLKEFYGKGATVESYVDYMELVTLASAYQAHYTESLTYEESDLRAVDAENFENYSSFSFNTYYLSASRFLEGGTTAEDGTTTYSDAEKAASVAAAEEAANSLIAKEITSVEALNEAISALPINAETTVSSSAHENTLYTSVSSLYADWVTDSSRKAGDKTVIANTSSDAEGKETVDGYYVVYFNGSTDNTFALKNVRHILVAFEGGTQDPNTGITTYTDEEKAAAKTAAEDLLKQWQADATEENFAAMANEHSDDGDGTTGGLYENIYPGQMVVNFNDWCFDSSRKVGDTGIVETEYGYHIMYFVGDAQQNYRDYLIEKDLRTEDANAWYTALVEAVTVTELNTKYIRKDLVLAGN